MKVKRKDMVMAKRIVRGFLTSDWYDELHIIKTGSSIEVKCNLSTGRLKDVERMMRFRP